MSDGRVGFLAAFCFCGTLCVVALADETDDARRLRIASAVILAITGALVVSEVPERSDG